MYIHARRTPALHKHFTGHAQKGLLKSTIIKDSRNSHVLCTRPVHQLYTCSSSRCGLSNLELQLIIQVRGIVGLASVPMIEHRPFVSPGPHREVEACELGLVE